MKKIILGFLIVLPFSTIAQPSTFDQFKAHKLFKEAKEYYMKRQFGKAVELLNQVEDLNPDHQDLYNIKGQCNIGLRNYQAALDDFDDAIERDELKAELFNYRGIVLKSLNELYYAREDFETAVELDPDYRVYQENLAAINDLIRDPNYYAGNNYPRTYYDSRDDRSYYDSYSSSRDGRDRYDRDRYSRDDDRNNLFNSERDRNRDRDYLYEDNPFDSRRDRDSRDDDERFFNDSPFDGEDSRYRTDREVLQPDVEKAPNGYVSISKVALVPTATVITFKVQAPHKRDLEFHLDSPGSSRAFFLTDRSGLQYYKLKDKDRGIRWGSNTVPEDKTRYFSLIFERLPNDIRFFHIRQGEELNKGDWNFYDVHFSANN